ncbi:hypothetical protein Are01nite_57000 [Actinoplanes regularis]|nr:hypothetical protein Are01nite_57000 [Actinoplanes regularis]
MRTITQKTVPRITEDPAQRDLDDPPDLAKISKPSRPIPRYDLWSPVARLEPSPVALPREVHAPRAAAAPPAGAGHAKAGAPKGRRLHESDDQDAAFFRS